METIKGRQIRSQRRHKDQINEHFYFILRSGVGVAVSLKAFHCQIEQGYSPKIVLFKSHFKFLLIDAKYKPIKLNSEIWQTMGSVSTIKVCRWLIKAAHSEMNCLWVQGELY